MSNNKSGIYQIKCKRNGKRYIGLANNIDRRWKEHVRNLNGKKHNNYLLQNDWKRYGEDAFEFTVLEYCPKWLLRSKEQVWIKKRGDYNIQRPKLGLIAKLDMTWNLFLIYGIMSFVVFIVIIIVERFK